MGSHMKKSIFDEQTSKAIIGWHMKAENRAKAQGASEGTVRRESPSASSDALNARMSNRDDTDMSSQTPPKVEIP